MRERKQKTIDGPYVEFEGTRHAYTVRPLREDEKTARYETFGRRETDDTSRPLVPRRCSRLIHESRSSYPCTERAVAVIEDSRGGAVCSRHLAGHKRSVQTDIRHDEKRRETESEKSALDERIADLPIEAWHHYSYAGKLSTEFVGVRLDDLEALAAKAKT